MGQELHENSENILKSNIQILFSHLESSIKNFVDEGACMGDLKYINAYLSATIHAVVCYEEKLIKANRMEETENVQALKFVNNLQKHHPQFVSITKQIGGLVFPMTFPFEIPMYDVVWAECIALDTRKKEQKECYENLFQGRPILPIMTDIVNNLINDNQGERLEKENH